jgi:hypothetical protein
MEGYSVFEDEDAFTTAQRLVFELGRLEHILNSTQISCIFFQFLAILNI